MSDELNLTQPVENTETPNALPPAADAQDAAEAPATAEPAAQPVAEVEPAAEVPVETVAAVEALNDAEAPAAQADALPESSLDAAPEAQETAVEPSAEINAADEDAAVLATPASMDELVVGMEVRGTVKRIELYGAFVDIGVGKDGLLHISQLGLAEVRNVEDVVKVGQVLNVFVLKVDKEQGRIALSLVKPVGMPWDALRIGMEVSGTVIKLETYGAFVDFGAERPGMVHVSELASGYVKSPTDVVNLGDKVTAQIIKLDKRKKRIDLSVKALTEKEEVALRQEMREEVQEDLPTAMELALRRAMDSESDYDRSKKDRDRADRRSRKSERDREDIFERTLRNHRG